MIVSWYGQSCFRIQAGGASLLLDPYGKDTALPPPRGKFDVIIGSSSFIDASKTREAFVITHPGEYEILNIVIRGIALSSDTPEKKKKETEQTIWRITLEDITIAHFDTLKREDVTPELIDALGLIDILLLPVGGGDAFTPEDAVTIMNRIEPRIVIPMRYKIKHASSQLLPVQNFLKEAGEANPTHETKLVMKRKNLPQDEDTRIFILDPVYETK